MIFQIIIAALYLVAIVLSVLAIKEAWRRRKRTPTVLPYEGTPPTRAHQDDAGLDLRANENTVIPSKGWRLVPTGTKTAIPKGQAGLVCPRSGLAAKHGITVLNAPRHHRCGLSRGHRGGADQPRPQAIRGEQG